MRVRPTAWWSRPARATASSQETLTALRDDGFTGFASLEPHLTDVNALGGFSGPRQFGRAGRAFRALTDRIGVDLV